MRRADRLIDSRSPEPQARDKNRRRRYFWLQKWNCMLPSREVKEKRERGKHLHHNLQQR